MTQSSSDVSRIDAISRIVRLLPQNIAYYSVVLGALAIAATGQQQGKALVAGVGASVIANLIDQMRHGNHLTEDEIRHLVQEAVEESNIARKLQEPDFALNTITQQNFLFAFGRIIQRLDHQTEMLDELRKSIQEVATAEQVNSAMGRIEDLIAKGDSLFDKEWFAQQVSVSVADAQGRYMPALNVSLPISKLFDAIGRNDDFYRRILTLHKTFKKRYGNLIGYSKTYPELHPFFQQIRTLGAQVLEELASIQAGHLEDLPIKSLVEYCNDLAEIINATNKKIDQLAEIIRDEGRDIVYEGTNVKLTERLALLQDPSLEQFRRATYSLAEYFNSKEMSLANNPALLITGEGGTGKTHLFCNIASKRIEREEPTILILGEKFKSESLFHQLMRMLMPGQDISFTRFLSSLDNYAESQNKRVLIMVDALNEASDISIWQNSIGGLVQLLSQYSHIAFALSIRTEYESLILPDNFFETNQVVTEQHRGFLGSVETATKVYFEHYGIAYTQPPLQQEFQNPLFLHMLCRSLENEGRSDVPTGLYGITSILDYYLRSVNKKLARRLRYNPRTNHVRMATNALVNEIVSSGSIYVPEPTAEDIVNQHLPNLANNYEESFYLHLLAEGVLTRTIHNETECVRFTYDRFTDHLIVNVLLEEQVDLDLVIEAFEPNQTLGKILDNRTDFGYRVGFLGALAIQLPERSGTELFEVVSNSPYQFGVVDAVLSSIVWRSWASLEIPPKLLSYINDNLLKDSYEHGRFLDTIIGVAANPNNPFNAHFLHRNLIEKRMAERDEQWSILVADYYTDSDENPSSIDRLINWANSDFDKMSLDPTSVHLLGLALSWFLTSSNRFLRDRATKALVRLFEQNIPAFIEIMQEFLNVDDPYILERLYLAAYGCAMRSNSSDQLCELATQVYEWIFSTGTPPPHILLRDYARGIVEIALLKCAALDIQLENVRPPYSSEWIEEPPSVGELKELYGTYPDNMTDADRAMRRIHHSVMNWDFGAYTLSAVENWTAVLLHDDITIPSKKRYEAFVESLEPLQTDLWQAYRYPHPYVHKPLPDDPAILALLTGDLTGITLDDEEFIDAELVDSLAEQVDGIESSVDELDDGSLLASFIDVLTPEQLADYRAVVENYDRNMDAYQKVAHFPKELAQRWILNRVFEFGWTVEKFGRFDWWKDSANNGRNTRKIERIGKKYQWIAFHELLARISDNYYFEGNTWEGEPRSYVGTSQLHIRDLDPSFLLPKTYYDAQKNTWWFTQKYEHWMDFESQGEWLEATDDLPNAFDLIEVTNPKDGSQWVNLDVMFEWEEPLSPIEDKYSVTRRHLWYMFKGYLVRRGDAGRFYEWALKQDYMGRWMPESHEVYTVFLGEFFWSPNYRSQRNPDVDYYEWNQPRIVSYVDHELPCPVCLTIDEYSRENQYDCTIDETVHVQTPSRWLAENMGLEWHGKEGVYHKQNAIVCIDPTVTSDGPTTLLMRKDYLLDFLESNDLDIVWTLLGEKLLIGDNASQRLRINGAYRFQDSQLIGTKITKVDPRQ